MAGVCIWMQIKMDLLNFHIVYPAALPPFVSSPLLSSSCLLQSLLGGAFTINQLIICTTLRYIEALHSGVA